ncbi:RagB/SusD family nutrient uptake outer membrane protein [Antarcticibacterium flavum]|uniref:RagB/SusD family nutrient uptake outer membrane protein n=1 Tax=Antarcticibacterium flavum TaxID=2058175 RepID=A0A5B7X150_9FLAO|nr:MULTISPECIES: RagB/SusD family nutrient uptake outer membrane protein [Antarcticibacterium]MCM4161603.1 RagB/SusD family nutrient uptake outer membrane protein [Antarcticibacterium sp. W02-3]QCY69029.1 RagB/SusD family nutrient uptake outer membrane protein [Antarcticibacterium flavum]
MRTQTILIALFLNLFLLQGCTDVGERVYDKYPADEFYGSPEGADVALAGVYSQIGGNWGGVGYAGADNGWYDLNSMSADEQVIPHRTTGDWQLDFARLYKHEWLPTDFIINNTWNWLYESVFSANLAVEQLENSGAEQAKVAEAKILRAFFYYLLMDDFGNVPFYTENNITVEELPQIERAELYDFIVSEITENVEDLPTTKGGSFYGRFNRWAAYALLAKVYMNAEVYTGVPQYAEALEAIEMLEQGGFSLHPGGASESSPLGYRYYELFGDTMPEDETILAIFVEANIVSRNIFTVRSLSGPHAQALFGYNGWNGTIVPTAFYEKYSDNDIRKQQFLVGQQPGGVTYSTQVLSLDNPGAAPFAGVRNIKFYPVPPMDGGGASNDFPIYRYADFLLMKAESHVRLGNAGQAKPFIDAVRQRAGLEPLASNPTLEDIYLERGFELNWEGHRRQDMIRFNTFLEPNDFRGASQEFRKLFPIPTSALNANPNLQQNPGY